MRSSDWAGQGYVAGVKTEEHGTGTEAVLPAMHHLHTEGDGYY